MFFQILIPIVLLLVSIYFALKFDFRKRFLELGKAFLVFAILLKLFSPVTAFLMNKSDEYVFYSKYNDNVKKINLYNHGIEQPVKKGDLKKAQKAHQELGVEIVKDTSETIGIILIQSLLIPILAFILLKKLLMLL